VGKKVRIAGGVIILISLLVVVSLFFKSVDVAVLNPHGEIAQQQRNLILFTLLLSSIVVIPVFILLATFAWKYREGNDQAEYRPNWDGNKRLEAIWWGIPCVIILVLGVVTWRTSHELDPFKPLVSNVQPINVQVVTLQWRWLFIYPEQRIASLNMVQFPENTPVKFTLTSDAPMNSFWIPSLGGQVYAMSGMSTELNLIANKKGDYRGSSANISGEGFADMTFTARVSTQDEFAKWVQSSKQSAPLNFEHYETIAQPSRDKTRLLYDLDDMGLYDKVIMKYMMPSHKDVSFRRNVSKMEGI